MAKSKAKKAVVEVFNQKGDLVETKTWDSATHEGPLSVEDSAKGYAKKREVNGHTVKVHFSGSSEDGE